MVKAFNISEKTYAELKKLADDDKRSISNKLEQLLSQLFLDMREDKKSVNSK
jgi:hypothetical protein